jgi:hypothetical protein
MIVIESVLMGLFATYLMDISAGYLVKRNLIHSFVTPEAVGRWFLYMLRGTLIHRDIQKTPPLKGEKLWGIISHYAIGIVLAGIYLLLEIILPIVRDQIWMPLLYGIATVFLPWFWLLPSIGLGFMASKSSNQSLIIRANLINHTNFGLGMFIWILSFHRFFI